jgi:ribA/ribD-fused uncharacterized protein
MPIECFDGEYRFLSNFHPAPVFGYPTAEHAYQAGKTLDPAEQLKIRDAPTATAAKRLGRTVTLRPEWNDEKFRVNAMYTIVREKFFSHPELGQQLLATGDEELIEGNWWGDQFWGVSRGAGKNWLGKILMRVRDELKA